MAGIGEDIKDVLQELGTPFTIIKLDGTVINGESLDYEMYFEQSTEFIRQFAYSGDFQYDSKVTGGDLIQFDNKTFLMMNVKKTLFENEPVDYSNFFIQCNSLGRISKEVSVRDPDTKKKSIVWETVCDNVYGCMVTNATNTDVLGSTNAINDKYTLFTQGFPGIISGFRYYPDIEDLTEYYQILSTDKYRFEGMLTSKLIEDSRE
jgi:hypothetical protein